MTPAFLKLVRENLGAAFSYRPSSTSGCADTGLSEAERGSAQRPGDSGGLRTGIPVLDFRFSVETQGGLL